ncbi:DUF1272 domain-containing protein [Kiloniella laminariae]|uniref:DUF1272 domain-containing protein n=1 Tax=Kiloniella laminariae TaxID=454162 RepID=A0ABT4LJP5_9PROT|nr:DUF1272 domain-containing protein [Kiloniella laminariae]MCZ4281321.1 DUF1272 domain-containing protein [Kiloniella laminariae]
MLGIVRGSRIIEEKPLLKLKPNCEFCDKDLPPESENAMICSYECTFCRECTENLLANVCPNCGGGFMPRPVRPVIARREGTGLEYHPASKERVHSCYSRAEIESFSQEIKNVPPSKR